ncbi:MAG TPA: PTS fructose transporter subunit IIA [Verrucomicrobia bacterium]|nr:PTS fructose transporter subunit IIA [Verrucomicrobiota bacterium]
MQLTVRDAARMLKLSERAVQERIEKGDLPSQCVKGRHFLNRDELVEWATAHGLPVALPAGEAPDQMPALSEALEAGGIVHHLPGRDKDSVLRHLVESMPLPADVDPDFLHSVLMAREALGSTAIGEGIAVPHPRSPILLRVPTALVTLCFLESPIDFGALDGRPVQALFSMISPTTRAHLHLLSMLAFALRDPDFKEAIARRAEAGEILAAARRIEAAAAAGK